MFGNLCDVGGVLVGHATDRVGVTGCTAVLFDAPSGAVVGVDVRGGAPGTRETDLLSPTATVSEAHAILLTGGSAFGLAAADGVVRFLEEGGVGYDVGVARVPIVPAAVVFDLAVGDPAARPGEAMGHEAASSAREWDFPRGSVGAGTGATVGKMLGPDRAMKGGIGSASIALDGGLIVASLAVVNALGDIRDPGTGERLAGPRLGDGTLADSLDHLATARGRSIGRTQNTTLGVVATNAPLTKTEATRVARAAHDGLARAIDPVHTGLDGDAIFAASLAAPGVAASPDAIGAWGARLISEAVADAVLKAEGLPGIPSISDLRRS